MWLGGYPSHYRTLLSTAIHTENVPVLQRLLTEEKLGINEPFTSIDRAMSYGLDTPLVMASHFGSRFTILLFPFLCLTKRSNLGNQ